MGLSSSIESSQNFHKKNHADSAANDIAELMLANHIGAASPKSGKAEHPPPAKASGIVMAQCGLRPADGKAA